MSSIIRKTDTYHGISVFGRGVFTNDKHGRTYAGQCKDGYACGLGVVTYSNGTKVYAEHGPDGQFDGRYLDRWAHGDTRYSLFERGKVKDSARVFADGRRSYNGEDCAPDDPRLLALIAQVAPVEVRPAAPAPHPPSARHSQAIVRWIGRLVLLAQALATAVAAEVHPHAACRRWWPCGTAQQSIALQRTTTQRCVHGPFCRSGRTGGTLVHPNNRRLVHTKCPSRQLRCRAIVQHTAVPNAATWGGLHVSVHTLHVAIFSGACLPGFAVLISRSVWQAEEAVASLPLRLAVRVHCGQPSSAGYSRGTEERQSTATHSHRTLGYAATGVAHGTARSEECAAAVLRARLPSFACRSRARVCG